ncbi:MAG TPA: sialidase family protein, partial [Nitriliruptorales bacterium]|nr:sialidase family protein [Nitriliruptorales bacterium]
MQVSRKVLLVVGAATALAACGTAMDRERQVTAPAAVVTDDGTLSRGHEAPSAVIDRRDPDTVYLADVEMFTGDCRFYVSRDAGRTWTEREAPRLEPYTDCGLGPASPKNVRTELIQGPDGTLYYAFHAHDPKAGGARSVLLGRTTDGGATWRTTAIHAAPRARGPENVEVNFLTHVAIDPDDPQRQYAMWRRSYPTPEDGQPRPTRAWMAVSDDGGDTFGDAFLALERDIGFDGPRP